MGTILRGMKGGIERRVSDSAGENGPGDDLGGRLRVVERVVDRDRRDLHLGDDVHRDRVGLRSVGRTDRAVGLDDRLRSRDLLLGHLGPSVCSPTQE